MSKDVGYVNPYGNPSNLTGDFRNRATRMLCEHHEFYVSPCMCAWSDLLGFGEIFYLSAWTPDEPSWTKLLERLTEAYKIHNQHVLGLSDFMLMLNDGIVWTECVGHPQTPDASVAALHEIALWLRGSIWSTRWLTKAKARRGSPECALSLQQDTGQTTPSKK